MIVTFVKVGEPGLADTSRFTRRCVELRSNAPLSCYDEVDNAVGAALSIVRRILALGGEGCSCVAGAVILHELTDEIVRRAGGVHTQGDAVLERPFRELLENSARPCKLRPRCCSRARHHWSLKSAEFQQNTRQRNILSFWTKEHHAAMQPWSGLSEGFANLVSTAVHKISAVTSSTKVEEVH